jgi:polyhydroxyalkanoate synthesis regulator phasin
MFEVFERGFLATVGMLSLSREKTQELVEDMVRRGELNRDESKAMVERIIQRGQEEQDGLRKLVRQEVQTVLSELDIATQSDIAALNAKLDRLLERLPEKPE